MEGGYSAIEQPDVLPGARVGWCGALVPGQMAQRVQLWCPQGVVQVEYDEAR
jgi:hypothetical protein|tara:strand:- start:943 stop:1098 length:156 start_codon:yes stop_codon:yes gene_type:complete